MHLESRPGTGKARRLRHEFVSSTGACARMQLTLLRAVASGCYGGHAISRIPYRASRSIWRFLFLDEDNVASLSLQTVSISSEALKSAVGHDGLDMRRIKERGLCWFLSASASD